MKTGTVPLVRALSKLGIMSRAEAGEAIKAGRVHVDGRIVDDPARPIVPERARIVVDGAPRQAARWRAIAFHKPRGVLTTRRDPEGRPTVFDALGEEGRGLIAVGRLDRATSGLLLLTTDTQMANWITDPVNAVPRTYAVTVRGRVDAATVRQVSAGVTTGGERLAAHAVTLRKASSKESHLMVELREGKNREVRRLFEASGHEVTRLKRVAIGALALDDLQPGEWREITKAELRAAFSMKR